MFPLKMFDSQDQQQTPDLGDQDDASFIDHGLHPDDLYREAKPCSHFEEIQTNSELLVGESTDF